jgi:hypothetical protein
MAHRKILPAVKLSPPAAEALHSFAAKAAEFLEAIRESVQAFQRLTEGQLSMRNQSLRDYQTRRAPAADSKVARPRPDRSEEQDPSAPLSAALLSQTVRQTMTECDRVELPCVAPWITRIPEIIVTEREGSLVPPASASAIADVVQRLMADPMAVRQVL